MTLIRADEAGREFQKVGKADGATRIWICEGPMPKGQSTGVHTHGGDEIFQVLSGTVRFHFDGRNMDVPAGHYVVVPPHTPHGFKVLTDDAVMQFVGELEMGEWVTVIDDDGTTRAVEVRSNIMPWHRPPADGEETDVRAMFAMMESTSHLLDVEPEGG
jgi:quercetin dioxygenase-like cupin family protein